MCLGCCANGNRLEARQETGSCGRFWGGSVCWKGQWQIWAAVMMGGTLGPGIMHWSYWVTVVPWPAKVLHVLWGKSSAVCGKLHRAHLQRKEVLCPVLAKVEIADHKILNSSCPSSKAMSATWLPSLSGVSLTCTQTHTATVVSFGIWGLWELKPVVIIFLSSWYDTKYHIIY
jgi:hypothetical protein